MRSGRRLFLVALLPLAIVVILGVLAVLPPRPGVTKANFDRISTGMPIEEVEVILGGKGKPQLGGVFDDTGEQSDVIAWHSGDRPCGFVVFSGNRVHHTEWAASNDTMITKVLHCLHLR